MEELDPNILKLLKKFKAKPRLERSVNSLLTRRINKNKIPKRFEFQKHLLEFKAPDYKIAARQKMF